MKQEYIINEWNEIENVKEEIFYLKFDDIGDFPILITKTLNDSYGESYFNIYFLDTRFKIEPLNNLYENIPLENEPKDWKEYLTCRVAEWELWFKFGGSWEVKKIENGG